MNAGGEMLVPNEYERVNVTRETEVAQRTIFPEQYSQMELAGQMTPMKIEMQEQQEMDDFFENKKLGKSGTIYFPEESEIRTMVRREEGNGELGEYRIFCDTHPGGSRYDIFADGEGK